MRHLDDGTLRRLYDEPQAVSSAERAHYAACGRCQQTYAAIAADARTVADLLAVPNARVNPAPALHEIRRRIDAETTVRQVAPLPFKQRRPIERTFPMYQRNPRRFVKPAGGLVAAAALVAALALTPLGALAESALTIFQPQQFTPVAVTDADIQSLRSLPDLSSYGTMGGTTQLTTQRVDSAAAATQAAGFSVLTPDPATLPSTAGTNAAYAVMSQGTASFTFSAQKAQAAAAQSGKTLPPMPSGLDGSTLSVSVGPVVVTTYGGNPALLAPNSGASARAATTTAAKGAGTARAAIRYIRNGTNPRSVASSAAASGQDIPNLIIAQAPLPAVTATNNVTVTEIETYLAEQPGVSPQLASEIESIGNPDTTLPIPIPIDRFNAQTVSVQGAQGLLVGDNTGIGSGVIWQKNGMVYGVAGTLTADQVMNIANHLQ